jgi:hypothetical protein
VTTLDLLRVFAAADAARWPGLPGGITVADAGAVVPLEDGAAGGGFLGEDRHPASWVIAGSETYEGGLYVWHDGGRVLLLDGRDPVDGEGQPLVAPELGEPELALDTVLGRLTLDGGERVYAARGLALRVNPANRLLLGVIGFAPVSAAEYRSRLRPDLPPRRLLPHSPISGRSLG